MDDYSDNSEEISALYRSVLDGDIPATVSALHEISTVALPEWFMLGALIVAGIHAISGLVRRAQPLAQPFADTIAEGLRESRKDKDKD